MKSAILKKNSKQYNTSKNKLALVDWLMNKFGIYMNAKFDNKM